MLQTRSIRRLTAIALLIGISLGFTQQSTAQTTTGSYMVAKMSGNFGAEGFAVYAQSKTVGVFGVAIDRWNPHASLLVAVQRGNAFQQITWLKTDADGHAVGKISSRFTSFPQLRSGDVIQVWDGRTQIMRGRLQVSK